MGRMALERFGPATREWFAAAFAAPTAAQAGAWAGDQRRAARPGGRADRLRQDPGGVLCGRSTGWPPPAAGRARHRCRVLYVSPLKALAVDVERNLRAPLTGIRQAAARLGAAAAGHQGRHAHRRHPGRRAAGVRPHPARHPDHHARVAVPAAHLAGPGVAARRRDGDRRRGARGGRAPSAAPTSRCRSSGSTRCSPRPAQRIGLSATVRPIDEVARFLGGAAPVEIVAAADRQDHRGEVEVPVEDMTGLDEPSDAARRRPTAAAQRRSIWPAVEERVLDLIQAHRSTIVFTNSRRGAERLVRPAQRARRRARAARRPAAGRRRAMPGRDDGPVRRRPTAPRRWWPGRTTAASPARSASTSRRRSSPASCRPWSPPSSLELGIDMGAVDLVVQIEAPPSVAAGLQRVGRAGHQVGAVSRGVVFPKHRGDLLSCAVVAERMRAGGIEEMRYPRNPLDVLAQQVVAMVAMDAVAGRRAGRRWCAGPRRSPSCPTRRCDARAGHALRALPVDRVRRAAPAPRLGPRRPTCSPAGRGAQRLAVTSGGTIPDRGLFGVFLAGAERAGPGRRARRGDGLRVAGRRRVPARLHLVAHRGHHARPGAGLPRARAAGPDAVLEGRLARPAGGAGPGDRRAAARAAPRPAARRRGPRLRAGGLDAWAADNLLSYLGEQREATRHAARRPDGGGRAVPRRAGRLAAGRPLRPRRQGQRRRGRWRSARGCAERYGMDAQVCPADDGIVVRLPDTRRTSRPAPTLVAFDPEEIATVVEESVGGSAMFAVPVPRVRRPGPAAAPPRPAPPPAAVAAAAAGRPTARRGPGVRRLPDHARRRPGSACRTCSTCPGWSR